MAKFSDALGRKVTKAIKQQLQDEGHVLTGALVESVSFQTFKAGDTIVVSGIALNYIENIEFGIRPENVSWGALPGLILFAYRHGARTESQARQFAVNIIKVWQKEGMSTYHSKMFSKTRQRNHPIQRAMDRLDIDNYTLNIIDDEFNRLFDKVDKIETI